MRNIHFNKIIVVIFFIISCSNSSSIGDLENICKQLDVDNSVTLEGFIHIDSKGTIIFDDINDLDKWPRKIELLPCTRNIGEYITSYYDMVIYTNKYGDECWVSVSGKYLDSTHSKDCPKFVVYFVALIEKPDKID